jgi:hypothetical protein
MRYLSAIATAAFIAGAGRRSILSARCPPEKQSTPTGTQLAARLTQSVDPFLLQSGG